MNAVINNWLTKILVVFILFAALLFGFSYYIYPTPYYFEHYSNDTAAHYFVKIDRRTGEVHMFSTAQREWKLLNK